MKMVKWSVQFGILMAATSLLSCAPRSHQSGDSKSQYAPAQAAASGGEATAAAHQPPGTMQQHWVQNDQLRSLMKELSATTQRDWPKDVPQNPEDPATGNLGRAIDSAAKLADGLAAAAERIPSSVTVAKMSEADRAGFQAEANTLRDQALRLGQAARAKKVEQMQQSLDALSSTCISCHSRYRDFSGQLNVQQVSLK